MKVRKTTFVTLLLLAAAATICTAEVPDDTAPEMKVKSRKLVFKADPKGLDWAGRGSLTKTKTGRWIATYTLARMHRRSVPRYVVIHTSDDEGRTWSKPNCLPDGTPVKGAPLRGENERIEPNDGAVLTCPNGDLLYVSDSCEHFKGKRRGRRKNLGNYQTRQWRSTDNGASWKFEGPAPGIPSLAGVDGVPPDKPFVLFKLGKTVEGGSIYITSVHRPWPPWGVLYRSDDNGHSWNMVSEYAKRAVKKGDPDDGVNETGVVCVDENTIMVVCRTGNEKATKMRISRDRGKTWGPMTDITKYVHVVQQPKLTKFPEEPGRIYLTRTTRDGVSEIYVMDADGNNQRNVTNDPGGDYHAEWSSDGKSIVFASDRDGNTEIYVMDADGNNQRRLTDNDNQDYYAAWSPDGQSIAFTTDRDGDWEIYVMDVDGNNQRNITNHPAGQLSPDWFDPAVLSVSAAAKLRTTWGSIKQKSE